MNKVTKNVFISHVHSDDKKLANLKGLIKSGGMDVKDSSITDDKPNKANSHEYIKSEILKPRIDWASILIVYISPDTKNSEWVDWEIDCAYKQEKIIIGVHERGARDCEAPEMLYVHADAIVGWDTKKIIDAINGNYKQFEKSDGAPCVPHPIRRHPCSGRRGN